MRAMTASPRGAFLRQSILEAAGTALLLAVGVAAVILPERLWAYDGGLLAVPFACAIATVALAAFARSNALNPALTLVAMIDGEVSLSLGMALSAAQIAGGCLGVVAAQEAFNLDAVQQPNDASLSLAALLPEFPAAFVFVSAAMLAKKRCWGPLKRGAAAGAVFFAVSAFTPLTSFANPAAAIARTLTSNALSLSALQAGAIVAAQLAGAAAAILALRVR
jgi:glycerol uptake facilitator-like aquaporin